MFFSFLFILSFLFFWLLPLKLIGIFQFSWFCQLLFYIISFCLSVVLTWIFVFIFLFLVMWFTKNLRVDHPFRKKIIASMSKLIRNFFRIRVNVYNKDFVPLEGKLILYLNHKTNFDPFIIASIFPRTISFLPKDELYHGKFGWFLSYYFNMSNCIKITRGNNRETIQNILKGINNIKKNLTMVVFYEGGIKNKTSDRIIHSLDGSFHIAFKSQANILPITLKGSCAMRGKCWFRKKQVDIFIHSPLYFENYKTKDTKEINKIVTDTINSVL